MRSHNRLATDNRRQDPVHRRTNNAVEKLLTLAALTKLWFVFLLGGLRRLIVTMPNKLSKPEADQPLIDTAPDVWVLEPPGRTLVVAQLSS
jgi:hypothetical protein